MKVDICDRCGSLLAKGDQRSLTCGGNSYEICFICEDDIKASVKGRKIFGDLIENEKKAKKSS